MAADLTAWRRSILDAISAGGPLDPAVMMGGRGNEKRWYLRLVTQQAAAAGEHIHVHDIDGTVWCVTAQPAGFLYARQPPPPPEPEPVVWWDEA